MLKILSNKDYSKFRIGKEDEEFDGIAFDELAGYYNGDEKGLIKLMKEHEATVIYHDFRRDKDVSEEDYLKHFENYNSDESFILPECTFDNIDKANEVLDILNKK